jgi:hypothetical protein
MKWYTNKILTWVELSPRETAEEPKDECRCSTLVSHVQSNKNQLPSDHKSQKKKYRSNRQENHGERNFLFLVDSRCCFQVCLLSTRARKPLTLNNLYDQFRVEWSSIVEGIILWIILVNSLPNCPSLALISTEPKMKRQSSSNHSTSFLICSFEPENK